MPFDSDFEDIFGDFDFFGSKVMKRFHKEIDEIFKEVKSGKLKGQWETQEIKEPGVNGFIIMGRFGTDKALEPFEPLRPPRRRPMPENPFELSEVVMKETREPLTDVFDEENATKIYVELPGEEEKDIHLDLARGRIEIKAENFHKTIDLQGRQITKETVKTKYKNGVLEITIPKTKTLRKEDTEKERIV
jgi:HSP20 family protein